ncbi:hypothetical protein CRM22_008986 [Opisthorchis felineus]|uniref:Uncharacterized protein n=1 Tax=Opisthorchis felineus TaxID=147828 RepID=A0A4S2L9F4_OPIFE|nr:hypothetical protein CRM22_008986 [Opisthorchis felineus]
MSSAKIPPKTSCLQNLNNNKKQFLSSPFPLIRFSGLGYCHMIHASEFRVIATVNITPSDLVRFHSNSCFYDEAKKQSALDVWMCCLLVNGMTVLSELSD